MLSKVTDSFGKGGEAERSHESLTTTTTTAAALRLQSRLYSTVADTAVD